MRKWIIGFSLLIVAACQQNKIGYVEWADLMEDYQEKKDIEEKYKQKSEVFTKKRDSLSQALQFEAQAFQAKAQSMAQKKAQEEYTLLQQKSQFLGQQLQQEEQSLQQQAQTEMDSMVSKVRKEIKDYGKTNGFTFVLGAGDGGSVLYGADAMDVTQEILKLLNDQYKK